MTPSSKTLCTLLSLASAHLLLGCGGTTPFESGDAGTAGGSSASTGGKMGTSGGALASGGKSSLGGSASGVGGEVVCCNGLPRCNGGDTQIASQSACPSGAQCYSVSLCCSQIWCARLPSDASVCNPTAEYNRKYMGTSAAQCQVIKFACPTNTTMFSNSCGCGCEQPASCPEYVDCMPGPSPATNSLCSDSACPYTIRAM